MISLITRPTAAGKTATHWDYADSSLYPLTKGPFYQLFAKQLSRYATRVTGWILAPDQHQSQWDFQDVAQYPLEWVQPKLVVASKPISLWRVSAAILVGGFAAYRLWRVVCDLNKVENQFIGMPNTRWPSALRFFAKVLTDWATAKWRSLAGKSLMNCAAEHEERFRHFQRKEWKDAPEPAPCHDKVIHGHPLLAAERRGVHLQAIRLLSRKGYQPYDISTSRRTLRAKDGKGNPIPGFHGIFSPRDIMYESRNDEITEKHALVLIDVDYYIDMHALAAHMRPMMLYTFCPGVNSGHTPESSWHTTFDKDGVATAHYSVNGGENYQHQMWDYGSASYVTFKKYGVMYTYAIERHRPNKSSTHQVIWLQPCTISVEGDEFYERVFAKTPVAKRLTSAGTVVQDGDKVTITDGSFEFVLRATLWQAILTSCSEAKTVAAPQMHVFICGHKEDLLSGDPMYLAEWIAARFKKQALPTTLVYASRIQRPDGTFFSANMKATHVEMEPKPSNLSPATPTADRCSDAGAITTRVAEVHNSTVPPTKYDSYLKEYLAGISELTGVPRGGLMPLKPDELIERVERAKTAAKIGGAWDTAGSSAENSKVFVEAFVKKEVYGKPGDERNISPTDDDHLSKLAPYAYAAKDLLCKLPQYMPGRTPKEISRVMQSLIKSGEKLWETDFSRYDGQQSRAMRGWETIFFAWFFADEAAARLVSKEIFNVEAKSKAGSYSTGGSLCSGSSLTTIMNTFKHMFIQYCTYRESGLTHEEAMKRLFAAYGDDGVLTGSKEVADTMARVCDDIGMKNLKCVEACTYDRPYLTFVGRVFLMTDEECAPSFQDPNRVWARINLVSNGPDCKRRYLEKMACFIVTDGNTPLEGAYCRKVLKLTPGGKEMLDKIEKAEQGTLRLCDLTDQWILVESKAQMNEAWPNDGFPGAVRDIYASCLGIPRDELDTAEQRVREATQIQDLNGLLNLKQPELNPRFVYDGIAVSYGRAIMYDNNKKTGAPTPGELKSILRTKTKVLGAEASKIPDPKPVRKPSDKVRGTSAKATGEKGGKKDRGVAPTGSGAPVNNQKGENWVGTPKSARKQDAVKSGKAETKEAGPAKVRPTRTSRA
jgi:hypothetical protein